MPVCLSVCLSVCLCDYLQVQSQGRHTTDHLQEKWRKKPAAVNNLSSRDKKGPLVNQTNIGTVSKVTLGNL